MEQYVVDDPFCAIFLFYINLVSISLPRSRIFKFGCLF